MVNQVKSFVFVDYRINDQRTEAVFHYQVNFEQTSSFFFEERIIWPSPIPTKIPEELLKNLLFNLHLVLGLSYWKTYCPPKIEIQSGELTAKQAEFWNILYTKGLGEFFYRNQIDFRGLVKFPYTDTADKNRIHRYPRMDRALVGIGGGKDSLVSIEFLKKNNFSIAGLALKPGSAILLTGDYRKQLGIEIITLERILDSQLMSLKNKYIGHIPATAIYSFLGIAAALVYNYNYFITSCEKSADSGNIDYLGQTINHQWSKSQEFEQLFQSYIVQYLTADIGYFSLLRPFNEIKIVEQFSQLEKYFPYFSSCNRNFSASRPLAVGLRWCGECAKCAFIFAMLAAFLPKEKLLQIFDRDLFKDVNLLSVYRDLLGFGQMKPFDCVGTFEESQVAFYLIWQKKEYANEAAMTMFEKEILPKIKNIEAVKKEVFQLGSFAGMPEEFRKIISY